MPEYLVEGWTEPIDQLLLADGEVPPGSGKEIELALYDVNGAQVDTTGKVTWLDESAGSARYSPSAGDLTKAGSPYWARWKVTLNGKVAFFPNDKPDMWSVRR